MYGSSISATLRQQRTRAWLTLFCFRPAVACCCCFCLLRLQEKKEGEEEGKIEEVDEDAEKKEKKKKTVSSREGWLGVQGSCSSMQGGVGIGAAARKGVGGTTPLEGAAVVTLIIVGGTCGSVNCSRPAQQQQR